MKPHLHIAIALVWQDGKVLCARRRADAQHLPDVWEFPGGKREVDETLEACVLREVREETGLKVLLGGAHSTITHDYETRIVTLHPFDCVMEKGEAHAVASREIRWLAPEEMKPEEFPPANASLIEMLQSSGAKPPAYAKEPR